MLIIPGPILFHSPLTQQNNFSHMDFVKEIPGKEIQYSGIVEVQTSFSSYLYIHMCYMYSTW